jgi:hypothetical protein
MPPQVKIKWGEVRGPWRPLHGTTATNSRSENRLISMYGEFWITLYIQFCYYAFFINANWLLINRWTFFVWRESTHARVGLSRDFSVLCEDTPLKKLRQIFFWSDPFDITRFSLMRSLARTELSLYSRADSIIISLQIDLFDNNFLLLSLLSSLSDFSIRNRFNS